MPKITVLMPVYNSESFLNLSIESILNQTYKDFEFIIINDASTDKSVEIIESYHDPRIKLIHNESNLGVASALNRGLRLAQGDYVARMDADDISMLHRLEVQVKYMDEHPDVGVCGSHVEFLDRDIIWRYPLSSDQVHCHLLFYWCMVHPTVMMRRSFFISNNLYYNPEYLSEDYDLWVRAIKIMKIVNLDEVLLQKRIHKEQVTFVQMEKLDFSAQKTQLEQLHDLGIEPTEEEVKIHSYLSRTFNPNFGKRQIPTLLGYKEAVNEWCNKIIYQNRIKKIYPEQTLTDLIYEYLRSLTNAIEKMFLLKRLAKNNSLYIWNQGGTKGYVDAKLLKTYGIEFKGIIDMNLPDQWGSENEGYSLFGPEIIKDSKEVFVIIGSRYQDMVSNELQKMGFEPGLDYMLSLDF